MQTYRTNIKERDFLINCFVRFDIPTKRIVDLSCHLSFTITNRDHGRKTSEAILFDFDMKAILEFNSVLLKIIYETNCTVNIFN